MSGTMKDIKNMRHALSLQRVYILVTGTGYYRLKAKRI